MHWPFSRKNALMDLHDYHWEFLFKPHSNQAQCLLHISNVLKLIRNFLVVIVLCLLKSLFRDSEVLKRIYAFELSHDCLELKLVRLKFGLKWLLQFWLGTFENSGAQAVTKASCCSSSHPRTGLPNCWDNFWDQSINFKISAWRRNKRDSANQMRSLRSSLTTYNVSCQIEGWSPSIARITSEQSL